ncbi:hypothetical protein [Clostridium sp. Marseille-P2415]|uniref:hypothetical protein n=1 Tax=Clostridium sp. Marseille-P2415 TaxID=1805471 RepID=UPI0011154EC3|nr:hypothetical protein [Clostridium sp. Marseille-P2415]
MMNILYDPDAEGCLQERVVLERIVLADGRLSAEIPAELKQMPESMKEMFYPYEERPEMILADADGKNQMTFQLIDKKLGPEETRKAAEAVREYINSRHPRSELSPVHLYAAGKYPAGWFTMELEEAGEKQHHAKAVLSVRNQMFLATATYPEQDRMKWAVLLKQFFNTLRETA